MSRFIILIGMLLVTSTALWFGWRVEWDWAFVREDPGIAFSVALGIREKPRPIVTARPVAIPTEMLRGELRIAGLKIIRGIGNSKVTKGAIVIRGRVENATNRIQKSITLQASLATPEGLAIESKRFTCCPALNTEGNEKTNAVSLAPGQGSDFAVEFPPKRNRSRDLIPRVEVTFSEAERVP